MVQKQVESRTPISLNELVLGLPAVFLTNTVACVIDGGYESDSEEGQDAGEGQTEVTDDAAHCFREHTGSVATSAHDMF